MTDRIRRSEPIKREKLVGRIWAWQSWPVISTRSVLEPRPVQRPGPPIWVASWGSSAGSHPLGDEVRQLELFRERVTGLVPRQP